MLYRCRFKMFYIKLSVILFLIRIFGVVSEDVLIISENKCITNSSLPIISNSPLKDIQNENNDYFYTNDNVFNNFDDGNCGDYCSGSWSIEDSSELIVDPRWEDLKTYLLPVDDKELYFEPTNIDIPQKDFKIPMSIRGREIHIFFCTEQTVTSKCIWFTLQGGTQTKSVIRQCNENQIPTTIYKYPHDECKKTRMEIVHTNETLFLFEDHWSHIFVQKQNSTWSLIYNDTTIISFYGSNSDPHYKNLILRAKIINALVKIHNYKFLSTTHETNEAWGPKITPKISCLKFFIKMCFKCSLRIVFHINRGRVIEREYKVYTKFQEHKWKEISISLPERGINESFYFITESDNATSPFWAVDNISPCPENGVRTITRHPEADCELVDGFGSQKLDHEIYYKTKINSKSNCTNDRLGFDRCFPCTESICGPKKYCQFKFLELKCACPPGSSVFNDECRELNQIRDLMMYSIETDKENYSAKVSFRWLPPWPPQSKISHFKIYYSFSNLLCNSPCKIWKNYICCTIELYPVQWYFDYKYTLKVTAVNDQNDESLSKELHYKVYDQSTTAPYNVITKWNDENKLKLSWNYPNFTYGGPITHFIYQINGISDTFHVIEENLTYTKNNIDVELEQEITILIKACNSECSNNTRKQDFSPPPTAYIPNEIETTSFNYTINLTLPNLNKICRKCQTIILLAIVTENKTIDFDKNVIFEYNLEHQETTFLIGDNTRLFSEYLNKTISNYPLKSGSYYNLSIQVINIYENRKSVKTVYYRVYTIGDPVHLEKPKKFDTANSNMAYFVLLILPIIVVGIFMYLKFKGKLVAVSEVENVPLNSFAQKRGEVLNLIPTSTQTNKSFPIALLDFEIYLKRSLENGSLEEQYENSINFLFNPVQKKGKDDIMGYSATKIMCEKLKYLLTESPTEDTVNLFFKIVWQQHVLVIVAIVDDENEEKILCPKIYQSRTVEDMTVTCTSEENQPYITLKRLKISMKTKEKEVCYIQLSNWKHSATFLYLNVVSLLKILNTFNNSNNQSILIHSGNGYSPSDIIILSDICLKMALRDNHIDTLKYFCIIKEKHNRFLDNFEKYKTVYLMILESMFRINTNISYEEKFKEKMLQTISNNLEAQFKYLKDTEWIDKLLGTENESPIYTELLQFQTRTMADRSKYQIRNFVNITGLLHKNNLYTMKEPKDNLEGFWRFVVDSNTNVIVVLKRLEDKETNIFWPQRNDVITIDPTIRITFVKNVKFDSYELISLNIQMQQSNFPITLYVFAKWKTIVSVPMEYKDAVSFITESASTLNKSDAIIFTCWNGNTGCGLFVGLYFLIEAIKSTKSCDVCHTVRYIRNFNRQFIQNMKQFKFLYEFSLESMLNYLIYDNLN